MFKRPCIEQGCKQYAIPGRPRCATHNAAHRSGRYDSEWRAHSEATIAAWRAEHGDICKGYRRAPHPVAPGDWTCDHELGALCRACNSSKANSEPEPKPGHGGPLVR